MASTLRVSIVMPAYNAERTIARAISSALPPTETEVELLVIDDASTDATVDVVTALAAQDPRVRLLRQAVNRGPAAARNLGLAQARGTWVGLLDADDAFAPGRIAALLALGERTGADIVADNLSLCATQGSDAGTPMIAPTALGTAQWLTAAAFVAGNIGSRFAPRVSYGFLKPLMRRDFLQRHDLRYEERNRFGEDFLLFLACLLNNARWWLTPQPMYRYTVRAGTLTDVQSAADLARIRQREEAVLRSGHWMLTADPLLADALRRHKAVIEHFYYYRAFTDALKARTFAPALRLLLESPHGFRHIMTESALQAPRVVLKALRGGFHHPSMAAAATAGSRQRGTGA